MLRVRVPSAFALAAMVVLLSLSEAPSQPGPGLPAIVPMPLVVTLLNAIDDPNVVAELKLSEEQVKTLVAHRQNGWDEVYTTALKDLPAMAAPAEATDALMKKTLTPEQYRRAVQLAAQKALASSNIAPAFQTGLDGSRTLILKRASVPLLNRHPELVTVFQLTDEQKKELAAGPAPGYGRSIALKPEQVAAVKEFLGPQVTKNWEVKSDPRLAAGPAKPSSLALLDAKDVRADVKLTDDQAKALEAVRAGWVKLANRRASLSPKEANAQAAALVDESEKLLAATLQPEQATRLKQIDIQSQARTPQMPKTGELNIDRLYKKEAVVKGLTLTEKQVNEIAGLWERFHKDATKAFDADEAYPATEQRLKDLTAARQEQASAVLNADQAAKLKALLGEPFVGSTQSTRGPDFIVRYSAATFGKYSAEIAQLAGNRSIQDELKMTAAQIKQAVEMRVELATKFPTPTGNPFIEADAYAKAVADRSKAVEKGLEQLLTAEQARRFREIMLQAQERPPQGPLGGGASVVSAATYPGVAEAIKLTDEQKAKLVANTPAAEVLTADQKAAIARMLGEPFKGDFTIPSPATAVLFGKYLAEFTQLADNKSIQDELKMTAEQVKQAVQARAEHQKRFTSAPSNETEAYAKLATERSKAIEEGLGKVLTAEQARRFREIMLQAQERPRGAPGRNTLTVVSAAAYPGVAEAIKLTLGQKAMLIANTPAAEVLTADQKAAIARMLGEPFKGDFVAFGGMRFPGTSPPSFWTTVALFRDGTGPGLDELLKLSPEQVKKIAVARDRYLDASFAGFPQSATALSAAIENLENLEKVVAETLTPEQKRRVTQLTLQIDAAASLVATLTRADMTKALTLTEDQKAKLTTLGEDAVKLQNLRLSAGVADADGKLARRLRDAADERMLSVLTGDQKAKWKELTGEPWTELVKTIPGGFGGPGGFRP